MKPRELAMERWDGTNISEIMDLAEGQGPPSPGKPESGARLRLRRYNPEATPQRIYSLTVYNGQEWIPVPIGHWVVRMEEGVMARMSDDFVQAYTTDHPTPELREYYESYRAAVRRLERIAVGVELLAMEVGTIKGQPNIGRFLQDRIRQLLCTHPERGMRYGHAEAWCSICFLKTELGDSAQRDRELMAHVVAWCKCDTSGCAVHQTTNDDLPAPTFMVPAIPEAQRAPQLLPANELVQVEQDEK